MTDFDINVGDGYHVVRINPEWVGVQPKKGYTDDSEIIPFKVVELAWNDQYVIAKQHPLKETKTIAMADESITNYWILNKPAKICQGPFDLKSFEIMRREIGLQELELKPVEYYLKENRQE